MAVAFRSSSASGASDTLSSSCTVPVPAGAAAGDIALLAVERWESTDPVISWPDGFSPFVDTVSTSDPNQKMDVAWKRLTEADDGNYVASWSGTQWNMGHCVLLTGGAGSGDPIEDTDVQEDSGTANLPDMSVDSTTEPFLALFVSNTTATSQTPPASLTEVEDGDYLHTSYDVPGTTDTHSFTDGSLADSNNILAAFIAVAADSGDVEGTMDVTAPAATAEFTAAHGEHVEADVDVVAPASEVQFEANSNEADLDVTSPTVQASFDAVSDEQVVDADLDVTAAASTAQFEAANEAEADLDVTSAAAQASFDAIVASEVDADLDVTAAASTGSFEAFTPEVPVATMDVEAAPAEVDFFALPKPRFSTKVDIRPRRNPLVSRLFPARWPSDRL